jgi:hypothetical protein
MFENRVFWRIFASKRDEMTRGWRKLHNEVPHSLEDEMGWACSAYGRREMHTKYWLGSLTGRDHSENLGIGGKIMLRRILWK